MESKGITQFYCENETVKIKKGLSTPIDLIYTPVKLTKSRCYIVFHDPYVGEFQYEIIGIS